MKKIQETIAKIKPTDKEIMKKARERLYNLTKLLGSLGRLEEIAERISGIRGQLMPVIKEKVIFTLAGAAHRLPVVLDGFIVGTAGLIAYNLAPQVKDYLFAAHCSVERGHKIILEKMDLKPLFDLGLRLGEGTGAALGISIIEAAAKILNEMATFEEASVSKKL